MVWGSRACVGVAVMLVLGAGVEGAAQQRPALAPDDYGPWESLGAMALSPDGTWVAYEIRRVNEEDELRIRSMGRDTARVVAFGTGATFSQDGRWLAYHIGLPPDQADEEGARESMGLLDLRSEAETVFQDVSAFDFSRDGAYLAVFRERDGEGGGDLTVRHLTTGTEVPVGNVAFHEWSPDGHLLAMVLESPSAAGNAVQIYDASECTLRVLDRGLASYRALTWREDHDDLVVLRAVEDQRFDEETQILLWRDLSGGVGEPARLDPAVMAGFPEDMRVSEHRTPTWSVDGGSLFFDLRPRERSQGADATDAAPADSADAREEEERSEVQVWHADDFRIMPMQRAQEQRDLERGLLSVWHVDEDRFLRIGTDLMASVAVLEGGRYVTEEVEAPYARDVMFGRRWSDVYLVDARSGDRSRILERVRYVAGGSPEGRFVLYFRGDDWWAFDVQDRQHRNLTATLGSTFADHEFDYPVEQLPPVGFRPSGWVDGDDAVLLRDAFDVWAVSPAGAGGSRLS